MKLNRMIDHTKLGPTVTLKDIDKLVLEAKTYNFKSVCVDPIYVSYVHNLLKDTNVLTCTVIGFPAGTHSLETKLQECREALNNGADEFDMVINQNALKNSEDQIVYDEIKALKELVKDKTLKVIIETCNLTDEEKITACLIAKEAGADFVKTSTGFAKGGAEVHDIKLMRETVGPLMGVKASGGVRTYEDAMKMIEAGATRIGASSSIQIVNQEKENNHDSNTTY